MLFVAYPLGRKIQERHLFHKTVLLCQCIDKYKGIAYHDKSLRTKVYSDIYRELKRQFGVTTYKAIKRSQCEKAIDIIDAYELHYVLLEQVQDSNAQMKMEVM